MNAIANVMVVTLVEAIIYISLSGLGGQILAFENEYLHSINKPSTGIPPGGYTCRTSPTYASLIRLGFGVTISRLCD